MQLQSKRDLAVDTSIVTESVQNKDFDLDQSSYGADAGTVGGGGTETRPNDASNSVSYFSKPEAAATPISKSASKPWNPPRRFGREICSTGHSFQK